MKFDKNWLRNKLEQFKSDPQFIFESALLEFTEKLASNQIDCPPEFEKLIDKHFWELCDWKGKEQQKLIIKYIFLLYMLFQFLR